MFEVDDKGIRISGTELYLDAKKKVNLSVISHAHSDHVRRHLNVIATPETISLIKVRNRKINAILLPYHQEYQLGDIKIELFPSGHILGAAQVLVKQNGKKLVYSGDFKPGQDDSVAAPMEIKQADILIMESTFGDPKFVFPKRWQVIERLVKFIDRCFQNGIVPVVMGYVRGKAQEALKILGELDYPVSIHPSIDPFVKVFERYGIQFKNYQVYHGENMKDRVLLIPPHLSRGSLVKKIWQTKKLMLSGWAVLPKTKYRYGADEALALSDHADFNQLIDYVHQVQPEMVFVTHGIDGFVQQLRKEGFKAELLEETPQLSLF